MRTIVAGGLINYKQAIVDPEGIMLTAEAYRIGISMNRDKGVNPNGDG
jgi:hypothetical protein